MLDRVFSFMSCVRLQDSQFVNFLYLAQNYSSGRIAGTGPASSGASDLGEIWPYFQWIEFNREVLCPLQRQNSLFLIPLLD